MDAGIEGAGLPDDVVAPATTRAGELFGVGELGALFPDRGNGPSPTAMTPWPAASRTRSGLFDREQVRDALVDPPAPRLVDPRVLWCSQSGLTWGGVQHYLEEDRYPLTGETWADKTDVGNLRPVVYLRPAPGGRRAIILSGHHRSAAALLAGRPVMAIVVDGSTGGDDARMVTERLLVGATTPLDHEQTDDPSSADQVMRSGRRALVPDGTTAVTVLERLGVDPDVARWRVDRALGASRTNDAAADAEIPTPPTGR